MCVYLDRGGIQQGSHHIKPIMAKPPSKTNESREVSEVVPLMCLSSRQLLRLFIDFQLSTKVSTTLVVVVVSVLEIRSEGKR